MRVLFVFEAGDGTIFPYVPLAQAVRGAGHEVLTATHAGAVPTLLTAGLPAVANSSRAPRDYRTATDGSLIPLPADPVAREEELGRLGAMIGIDAHAGLQDVIVHWRPDVVVGCAGALAGPLAAAQAGVPLVRFAVDIGEIPLREVSALEHLRRSGHPDLPDPALSLTTWPLSIRPADVAPAEPIRHVPYATPRPFEPWMFVKGERPRVLVSAGSRVSRDYAIDHVSDMIRAGSQLNAELLVAVPDSAVADLPPLPAGGRAGWIPIDTILSSCDLVLHNGGGITTSCMLAGLPQVLMPNMPEVAAYSARIDDYGAGRNIRPGAPAKWEPRGG